jgi:Hemerythrin HHE cation binding domain
MKRSPALAPLSRDHQHALDAALRLRRADADTVAAAVAHFRVFFEAEGRRHFAIEEEFLLPALPADDHEWSAAVARVVADHAEIRAAVVIDADVAAARLLGDRLHDHVRFEERVLFEILERRLSERDLDDLGRRVLQAEEA